MEKTKKLLLTSALLSGLSSVAFADAAGTTVTAGGSVNFKAAFIKQQADYKTGVYTRTQTLTNTSKVNVKAEGMSDFGMKYGAFVELGNKTSSGTSGTDIEFKDSYMYFETNMGKLLMGSKAGASKDLKVDASDLARATGGIDGDFEDHVNTLVGWVATSDAPNGTNGAFLTSPTLPLDQSSYKSRYNKISYYTPEIAGFTFGVTYATDSGDIGGYKGLTGKYLSGASANSAFDLNNYHNVVTGGVKYKTQVDQFGIELGATGQYAKSEKDSTGSTNLFRHIRDVKAYNVGANIAFSSFNIAGSYGNWGKSGNTKETDQYMRSSTRYYTVGGSYVQGPVGLSVTYMDSKRLKNQFEMISAGADYALAPGVSPYVEANFFKLKPAAGATSTDGGATPATKNKGNVVFVGSKFKF